MNDDHPAPQTDFGIGTTVITARHPNLRLSARKNWHDSQQAMSSLLSEAPAIRQMIREAITQQWTLNAETVGLLFDSGRRMPLPEACAFVAQRSPTDADLDDTSSIYGLPESHALSGLTNPCRAAKKHPARPAIPAPMA